MEHSELAARFNAVGQDLEGLGHVSVLRKARDLIEGGDASGAAAFLQDAAAKTNVDALSALATDFRAWSDAGGSTGDLTRQDAWSAGKGAESRAAHLITQATAGSTENLIDSLTAQTKAQAAGEAIEQLNEPAPTTEESMQASDDAPTDTPPAADEPPTPAAPAAPPTGAMPPPAPYEGPNGFVAFAVGMAILVGGYVLFYSLFT